MALVLKPPQRRLLPVGKLKIDPTHPLANGLVACYVPGVSAGINLVGNGGDLGFDTAATIDSGVEGPGLSSPAANSGMFGTASAPQKTGNTFSVYWRGYMLGNAVAFCDFLSTTFDNATGSPFNGYGVGAGVGGSTGNMRLVWSTGAASNTLNIGSFSATGVQSIGGSFAVGGNAVGYLNGVNSASTTFGGSPPSTSATTQVCLNTYQSVQTRVANAVAFIGCIWNRALSDAEHAAIEADPYGFLIPAEGEMPALFLPATTTSGGARIRQRWNRSPLAYPAGAVPGVDRSHPASQNCTFSGIATQGGTFGNILSRVKGTENGTKTTSLYSSLGPATNYTAGGSENTIFPFLSAASAPITLAGIFKMTAMPGTTAYLLNNNAAGSVGIGDVTAAGTFSGFHELSGTQDVLTGVSYIVGVPYFFAMSFSLTLVSWVVARLDTGQVFTGQVANTTGVIDAGDGNITVGSRSGAARQLGGGIAAAMASNAFMSQQQLRAWAADPWSFWYPNNFKEFATTGTTPPPPTIITPSRTLMGVGT